MIILKTLSQIDSIRKSCKILAYILSEIEKEITSGITTNYLNKMAEDLCFQKGGIPGFKNYKGYPYSICASKNEEIVHGFPNNIPLKDGDIISIDFGVIYKGWYGDAAFTKGVGVISYEATKLINSGLNCLFKGIENTKPYCRVGDISNAIQTHAEASGYNVIKNFVGHGIGKNLHELPQIPNYGRANYGYMLKPGTVIAIEPMLTQGIDETITLSDGWTTATKDNKLSVHFEHTVAILSDCVEILTKCD